MENLLAVRRLIVHVRIANHLLEEPVVLGALGLLAHLLGQYRIKLVLDRTKLTQKCTLLQLDVIQLLHVALVSLLNLT